MIILKLIVFHFFAIAFFSLTSLISYYNDRHNMQGYGERLKSNKTSLTIPYRILSQYDLWKFWSSTNSVGEKNGEKNKMIISASRRTDIPAFYTQWLLNRFDQGFVMVRNHFNPRQISKISLEPSVVDCIVFWTRNPNKLLPHLHNFNRYPYYFQFTIMSYGQILEPHIPDKETAISVFKQLSEMIGPERVIWRYDPILLSKTFDIPYHFKAFNSIASQLKGHTKKCVISFIDLYKKTKRNMQDLPLQEITDADVQVLAKGLGEIAQRNDLKLFTCAEPYDLSHYGIFHSKCIDDKLISEITGHKLSISKDKTQRAECGCVASIDIGAYDTCPHGCRYCYANSSSELVKKNMALHNPDSPLLYGNLEPGDKVKIRQVDSYLSVQKKLLRN